MARNTSTPPKFVDVALSVPIIRGEQKIDKLKLRRPDTSALRGCSLGALVNSNVDQLMVILPRITDPALTDADVINMDIKDLVACAGEVVGFLTE